MCSTAKPSPYRPDTELLVRNSSKRRIHLSQRFLFRVVLIRSTIMECLDRCRVLTYHCVHHYHALLSSSSPDTARCWWHYNSAVFLTWLRGNIFTIVHSLWKTVTVRTVNSPSTGAGYTFCEYIHPLCMSRDQFSPPIATYSSVNKQKRV